MKDLFKKLFRKEDEPPLSIKKDIGNASFLVKVDDLIVGCLKFENGLWEFSYSKSFKEQEKYYRLVGFSDLDKTYRSDELWPFFKIRIPGLKQPLVKEILKKENIDPTDEVGLLKRFGRITSTNPYLLEPV